MSCHCQVLAHGGKFWTSVSTSYIAHWFRVVGDAHIFTFMSEWLTLTPPLHHRSIVIPLYERRSIRSCVTELLSDIRAVQMDDPTTLAWPTDKKPLSFCPGALPSSRSFLPYSFSESTAAVICYTTEKGKKKVFFPGFPAGPHPTAFFFGRGGAPEGTGSLVVSSHRQRPTAESIVFVLG